MENFGSIDDVVQFAIEKEREAADFYRTAAENEALEVNKNVLIDFAEEEEKHEQMLKDFSFDKKAIEKYTFKKIEDIKRADYLMDMDYEPGMNYFDVMRIAMKREEKAYKLYNRLKDSAEDEHMENIFAVLAHEELKHKSGLEKIYDDHLATTGD
jgi:rubrerythrin